MTETVYAVIDNHSSRRSTKYSFMFKTKDFRAYMKYLQDKGLVN